MKKMSCIDCNVKKCNLKQNVENNKPYPEFCVSKQINQQTVEEVLDTYMTNEMDKKIMCASAEIEHDYYCQATRVEETIRWAKKLNAKKIGIASCVGLLKESHILAGLLREYGFEVFGAGCKIGEVPKTEVGIPVRCEETGVHMCNPILQAQLLNREKTDINIVMGLCVGHDSLFYKYAEAPTTTLIVKDRVLGNNPAVALYTLDSYYKKLHNLEEI